MKIWVDITNTPHVNVVLPILRFLEKKHELILSARDFSETIPLLNQYGIYPIIIGGHKGKNRIRKVMGMASRLMELYKRIPEFDLSFSLGGNFTATNSWLRRKPSIIFSDNDISFKALAYGFGTYFVFPSYFKYETFKTRYRIKDSAIHLFNGFKEDIYIADYQPDPNFLNQLPFKEFITIRPENLKASYVPINSRTIVPELFKVFKDENILFLPRYIEERQYAVGSPNVFMPDSPLNGLDVCYYSKAILTGAGTFAREAALMGTPAVSFFPGKKFLNVDVIMQERGWEFKSRDPKAIYEYVIGSQKRKINNNSQIVLREIETIFCKIINDLSDNSAKRH